MRGCEERGGESHSYSEDMSVLLVADPDKETSHHYIPFC